MKPAITDKMSRVVTMSLIAVCANPRGSHAQAAPSKAVMPVAPTIQSFGCRTEFNFFPALLSYVAFPRTNLQPSPYSRRPNTRGDQEDHFGRRWRDAILRISRLASAGT